MALARTPPPGGRSGHERPIVLFVGRLVYYKGVDVLVEAMPMVDADFVIIGQGPLEAQLRERAFALGVLDRITFLPPQRDDELAAWYHAADLFCLPSVARSEAFGLVQMKESAEYLSGEFTIEGRPGRGTTVKVVIPCSKQTLPPKRDDAPERGEREVGQ